MEQHTAMYRQTQRIFEHFKIDHAIITPWFTVSDNQRSNWELPLMYGDKGMIPRELPQRIRQFNRDVTRATLTAALNQLHTYIKWCVRTIYSNRMLTVAAIKYELEESEPSAPPPPTTQSLTWIAPTPTAPR
jgi:hypothetical protein